MSETKEQRDATPCFIGRKPGCGCLVAVSVDLPEFAKSNAKTVGDWIRDDLLIEKMTVSDFRKVGLTDCPHGKPAQQSLLGEATP